MDHSVRTAEHDKSPHTHRPANTCNHSMFVEINPENDESLAQQKKEA